MEALFLGQLQGIDELTVTQKGAETIPRAEAPPLQILEIAPVIPVESLLFLPESEELELVGDRGEMGFAADSAGCLFRFHRVNRSGIIAAEPTFRDFDIEAEGIPLPPDSALVFIEHAPR